MLRLMNDSMSSSLMKVKWSENCVSGRVRLLGVFVDMVVYYSVLDRFVVSVFIVGYCYEKCVL